MGKLTTLKQVFFALLFCAATTPALTAQAFKALASFGGIDGDNPYLMALVQGRDGNLYGTTREGGANGQGAVFRITPAGRLEGIYSFCAQSACSDGNFPYAGLVLGTDGDFYGTTSGGGVNSYGTVFRLTPTGALTTLHSFANGSDGAIPGAALIEGTDGNFYGTTTGGGSGGWGVVFKITASAIMNLASFDLTNGGEPFGSLVRASDGAFYGTTRFGGDVTCSPPQGCGTVFKVTPSGTLTTLHSFESTDGAMLYAGLAQGADGNFYGTTYYGGDLTCNGTLGCGTVFKITPEGTLTTLHIFENVDGSLPTGGLVEATDGNFYGTTPVGEGNNRGGTVFRITAEGVLTTLNGFPFPPGGMNPDGTLLQATNGNLYGTTFYGGIQNDGTVFSGAVGLSPFIETLPSYGNIGSNVRILGTNLTGTTSVTFNGTAATFTVVSATDISTTVPAGATTGKVQVTSPNGIITGNVVFRVP